MIREEIINRKIALKRVKDNISQLKSMPQTIESIFAVSFKQNNYTLFNEISHVGINETSYGEAKKSILKFATFFQKDIGADEKYVGILLENSPTWIYSFYGLLMAGFVPVLLSTKNSVSSVINVCNRLGVKTIITENCIDFHCINPFLIEINEIKNEYDFAFENEIIFTTSGTTGESKIVSFVGERLCEQIYNAAKIVKDNYLISQNYNGYLKHLVILPLFHVFGLIAVFMWFSFFNTTFIFPRNLTPNAIRQASIMGEATHIFAVPLFWKTLNDEITRFVKKENVTKKFNKGISLSIGIQKLFPKHGPNLVKKTLFKPYLENILGPSVSFCINGGAFLSVEAFRTINGLGYPLVNGYGSTETGITSFVNAKRIKDRLTNGIGFPFEGITYKLDKETSELIVSGKSISNKIMMKDVFEDNTENGVRSNDIAYIGRNGYYLRGRQDEIYVDLNGENYLLPEIEKDIKLSFADSFIVCESKQNKTLTLLVSYSSKVTEYQINNDLSNLYKNGLDNKIKEVFYTRFIFPKANEIKIQRNIVKKYFVGHPDEFIKYSEQNNCEASTKQVQIDQDILNTIKRLFKDVLNVESINDNSNFYNDLGGDSLRYFILLNDIKNTFDLDIDTKDNPPLTPADFALLIMKGLSL